MPKPCTCQQKVPTLLILVSWRCGYMDSPASISLLVCLTFASCLGFQTMSDTMISKSIHCHSEQPTPHAWRHRSGCGVRIPQPKVSCIGFPDSWKQVYTSGVWWAMTLQGWAQTIALCSDEKLEGCITSIHPTRGVHQFHMLHSTTTYKGCVRQCCVRCGLWIGIYYETIHSNMCNQYNCQINIFNTASDWFGTLARRHCPYLLACRA